MPYYFQVIHFLKSDNKYKKGEINRKNDIK